MIKKTFIVISLSDRVNDLNNLITSIMKQKKFDDYDINLIYQDYLNNKEDIKYKERYTNIFYSKTKLGCHGARVTLLNLIDINNYDIFINLDDDMELVEQTDYEVSIQKAMEENVGFVLTNWARSEKLLLDKIPKMKDKFEKQVMVYQGGGMVYSRKIAQIMKELPKTHAMFDDIWCISSYVNGYDNYRYLGSLAIHRVCAKGGMRAYMKEKQPPLLSSRFINYRYGGKNNEEVLIPNDSDINYFAKELHRSNKK